MFFGVESLLKNKKLIKELSARRVALVGHPASVNHELSHSLDLIAHSKINLTCAFGPQHGLRGEKQDNMIESADYVDPNLKIPIFSLYGEVRRPTKHMLDQFDVVLVDMLDVGCRIYTFLTTLIYLLEDCARAKKAVWVLDRPNPAGRPVEGGYLDLNFKSFVGAAEILMRHGLTLGEAGKWYVAKQKLDLEYKVIKMSGYRPEVGPGWGWPEGEVPWINPSPNLPRLSSVRMFTGTVLIEGTKLSEGRGTTRPLEVIGAPQIDGTKIVQSVEKMIPRYLKNTILRPCYFEPTFQKHKGQLCSGLQIHIDHKKYNPNLFKPYRIVASVLKSIRKLYPDLDLWQQPPYEYEHTLMPIDMLSGTDFLRKWVDDSSSNWSDLENELKKHERNWLSERRPYLIY